jgi:hypothetical protein
MGMERLQRLPTGITAAFASNTITISGTTTVSRTFNYSIPTGGCGAVNDNRNDYSNTNNTASAQVQHQHCVSVLY